MNKTEEKSQKHTHTHTHIIISFSAKILKQSNEEGKIFLTNYARTGYQYRKSLTISHHI